MFGVLLRNGTDGGYRCDEAVIEDSDSHLPKDKFTLTSPFPTSNTVSGSVLGSPSADEHEELEKSTETEEEAALREMNELSFND